MAKFKKGDRVRYLGCYCTIPVGTTCRVLDVEENGIDYEAEDGSHSCWEPDESFELIGGTMNVGDILVDKNGNEYKILAYLNQGVEVYLLSLGDNFEGAGAWYTPAEIKKNGWKLQSDTEPIEKTVAELEEELGLEPGKLRIKKGDK